MELRRIARISDDGNDKRRSRHRHYLIYRRRKQGISREEQDHLAAEQILPLSARPHRLRKEAGMERRSIRRHGRGSSRQRNSAGMDTQTLRIERGRLPDVLPGALSDERRTALLDSPECGLSVQPDGNPLFPAHQKQHRPASKFNYIAIRCLSPTRSKASCPSS